MGFLLQSCIPRPHQTYIFVLQGFRQILWNFLIMSSVNTDSFLSIFPMWCIFKFFIGVAWLPVWCWTRLMRVDFSLIPAFRENIHCFSITPDVTCWMFLRCPILVEEVPLYSDFAGSLHHEWLLVFVKCSFCINWYEVWSFLFRSLTWQVIMVHVQLMNQPCISRKIGTWLWHIILFIYYSIWIHNILIEDFHVVHGNICL